MSIDEAVEFFVKEGKLKKRGNVELSLAFSTLDNVSKMRGLSAENIISLMDVAASGRHGDDISWKLLRLLIPATVFPERAVVIAISHMCTNKPSTRIQSMILRLILAVYDYLDRKDNIQKLNGLLFYFLENTVLIPYVCHLLYLLTRQEDVKMFRVRKLLDLQARLGPQPYLIGLLSIYKLYYPTLVSIELPNTRKLFFPVRDRHLSSTIRNVQEQNQTTDTSHLKTSLELSKKLRMSDSATEELPSKRRKIEIVPQLHSSNSRLTVKQSSQLLAMLEERPIPFVQIPDMKTLLKNPVNIEFPSQMGAALKSPLLQHFMSYMKDPLMNCRFSYWLQDTLCDELLDNTVLSRDFPRIESFFEKLIQFSEFIQEGIPIVDQFLFRYLQIWNGLDFRQQIFRLITRCRLYTFSALNENLLDPLRKLYTRSSVFIKCQITMCLTQMLRNYASVEIWRYKQKCQESQSSVYLFEDDIGPIDYLSTLINLIKFIDRLNSVGLNLEQGHNLLMHYTLQFSEMVSDLYIQYGVPCVFLPSKNVIRSFLVDNAVGPTRVCGIVNNYRANFMKRKERKEVDIPVYKRTNTVEDINTIMLDISNALWRNMAFSQQNKNSFFNFTPKQLNMEVSSGLSLNLHQAFLPFSLLFLKETQPAENIGHPRAIKNVKDTFMEFLKREFLDEILDFVSIHINRKQRDSSIHPQQL